MSSNWLVKRIMKRPLMYASTEELSIILIALQHYEPPSDDPDMIKSYNSVKAKMDKWDKN